MKNLTPKTMLCGSCGCGCPAIFENDNKDFVVIGKHTTSEARSEISSKISVDEDTVTLPRELLVGYLAENWESLQAEVQSWKKSQAA